MRPASLDCHVHLGGSPVHFRAVPRSVLAHCRSTPLIKYTTHAQVKVETTTWYYLYLCMGCTIAFGLFHRKVHEDFVLVLFQSPQGLCDICSFAVSADVGKPSAWRQIPAANKTDKCLRHKNKSLGDLPFASAGKPLVAWAKMSVNVSIFPW